MGSPSHTQATIRYDAENTIRVTVKFNKKTDADLIAALDKQENKQGYIKRLMREQISK